MAQKGRHNADHKLITALACGLTKEAAARQAGVSERTVYRRLDDPVFKKQVDDARAEIVRRTMSTLTAAGLEAVKTLMDLLKPATGSATRLGSARAVLELGGKFREMVDFEERLVALEQRGDEEPAKTKRWS